MAIFVYPLIACWYWLFFFIDDLFRPSVKAQIIEKPLFIVGNFRSGSTFLQRLLFRDTENFSSGTAWELVFAPSFTMRQFIKGVYLIDKRIGSPLHRLITRIEKRVLNNNSVHAMGLREPEEDEGFFLHNLTSAFLIFATPSLESHGDYYKLEDLSSSFIRSKEMSYFEGCVKRHMRFHPRSRHYLSKSPTFSARCVGLQKQFPDARFVYLLRHPLNVLPSLMTWFTQVWSALQKRDTQFPHQDFLVDFVRHWYVDVLRTLEELPDKQLKIVHYEDLVSDPFHTVESIYNWLDIPVSDAFYKILSHEGTVARKQWKQGNYKRRAANFDFGKVQQEFAETLKRFSFAVPDLENGD